MVSPSTKRRAVRACTEAGMGSTAQACRALGLARSTFYLGSRQGRCGQEMNQRIIELSQDHPRYGYRRITAVMRREGWEVNAGQAVHDRTPDVASPGPGACP